MNMPVKLQYFKNPKNRELTQFELDELARELDAIKQEVLDDLGEKDAEIYPSCLFNHSLFIDCRSCLAVCRLVPASMVARVQACWALPKSWKIWNWVITSCTVNMTG